MANIARAVRHEYSELIWPNAMWRWPTRSGTDEDEGPGILRDLSSSEAG